MYTTLIDCNVIFGNGQLEITFFLNGEFDKKRKKIIILKKRKHKTEKYNIFK